MSTFSQHLAARGEHGLVALLQVRPDLAAPPPSSVRSLAARAANRASLERALVGLDAQGLATLEAVLALEGAARPTAELTVDDLAAAMGLSAEQVAASVQIALDHALLWTETPGGGECDLRASPGLDDVLGPYPAGLGPPLASSLARRTPQTLARMVTDIGLPADPDVDTLARTLVRHLADPVNVLALLDRAPAGARAVLEALAWGPPVGRSPAATPTNGGPARGAVDWLLRHGLLAVGDPQHVVLPREVALALRGGLTHRDVAARPAPDGAACDPRTVDAESARHAEDLVRLVDGLVAGWGREQPPVLRSGGLGSRELRRIATRLEITDAAAALVVEIAGAAGLVADDGDDPPTFTPTTEVDEWRRTTFPERWVTLAEAWLGSERAAWLVGTRDERGNLRAALDPELRRPWAPRLRTTVLQVLAEAGPVDRPLGLDAGQVHEVLRWRTPRAAPALHAVEAVLVEAGLLGVVGAGAISTAGRALLTDPSSAAAALFAQMPPAVDEVLLQGDLTGIVPGRPSPELTDLLDRAAHVESRGAGVTVRFTEATVRAALDTGTTAEDLLAELSRFARSGVPQPLEYLVLDTARRHGQVRVGTASSYLRADDPTLLAGLVEDRTLRALGLLRLAPTVIAAQAPVAAVLAALRERGLSPVPEDAAGHVVVLQPAQRRVRSPRGRGPRRLPAAGPARTGLTPEEALDRRLHRLARDLLTADQRELVADFRTATGRSGGGRDSDVPDSGGHDDRADAGNDAAHDGPAGSAGQASARGTVSGSADPVLAIALLREAAAEGREVWLEMIGADGAPSRRRVRPLRVDAGRVRALDAEREAELTVAVHRIASVTPV